MKTGKINSKNMIIVALFTTVLILLLFGRKTVIVEKEVYVHPEIDTISIIQSSLELNDKNVYLWLQVLGVEHDSIVLAQSKLETGNYESNVCLNSNNLFGFLNSSGYYEYRHWIGSVIHYAQWQQRLYDGQMPYPHFLVEVGYAEDKNYIEKLKQF
jgi:hypothetical protein